MCSACPLRAQQLSSTQDGRQDMALKVVSHVEAMHGQGHLTLAVERHDGEVRITVGDTGPGIPPKEQRRVLQRFFRERRDAPKPAAMRKSMH